MPNRSLPRHSRIASRCRKRREPGPRFRRCLPSLQEVVGEPVVKRLRSWFKVKKERTSRCSESVRATPRRSRTCVAIGLRVQIPSLTPVTIRTCLTFVAGKHQGQWPGNTRPSRCCPSPFVLDQLFNLTRASVPPFAFGLPSSAPFPSSRAPPPPPRAPSSSSSC
jgi:hypothetical protein